jgi:hypothetical protein
MENRYSCRELVGKSNKRHHWEDLEINGSIILKLVLEEKGGGRLNSSGSA